MKDFTPWIIKYRPKKTSDIINQAEAVEKLKMFIEKYPNVEKKAALLYGPPGCGKTSCVYAIANEIDYEVVEMNASDVRSARKVWGILGPAIKNKPFFKKGRIILIDEVDGMSGKEDKGGLGAIINIIKESIWPVILTANDPWDPKFKRLRNECIMIEFKKLGVLDVFKALKRIAMYEKLNISDVILRELASRSEGDLRSAINDLQTLASLKKELTKENLSILGYRDREKNIFHALGQMFKSTTILSAISSFDNIDMDPKEVEPWIIENIPVEYEDIEEIWKALDWCAKADLFYSRIFNRQYWGLLKYYTLLMYAGTALAKKQRYRKFTKYKMPEYVKKLSLTKEVREYIQKICLELKQKLHTSSKRIRQVYLNLLFYLLKTKPEVGKKYAKVLGLKPSEIEYLSEVAKKI